MISILRMSLGIVRTSRGAGLHRAGELRLGTSTKLGFNGHSGI